MKLPLSLIEPLQKWCDCGIHGDRKSGTEPFLMETTGGITSAKAKKTKSASTSRMMENFGCCSTISSKVSPPVLSVCPSSLIRLTLSLSLPLSPFGSVLSINLSLSRFGTFCVRRCHPFHLLSAFSDVAICRVVNTAFISFERNFFEYKFKSEWIRPGKSHESSSCLLS